MIEIMTLAIPLHDIGAFFIVDVLDAAACVGADALPVKPGGVCVANGVRWETAEIGQGKRLGSYAWSVAQDPAAGGIGKHCIAETVDEEGCCGGFAEGCD